MSLKSYLARRYQRLRRVWRFYRDESGLPAQVARGHFYSPLPDITEGVKSAADAFLRDPSTGLPGLNLQVPGQRELLLKMCGLYPEFDWTEEQRTDRRFHFNQGYYNRADSICLYSMLRLLRPHRVVEVGSGYSSALMLDVNDRFLDRQTHLTFIEPYPDRLESILRPVDRASTRIIERPVQKVPMEIFAELRAGDFLFIDSSHVSKVGSDVNHLFFEVIPRLPVGVLVHVHDIFWPFDYPAQWIRQGQAWNEAYLLRALLSHNDSFEIVFWTPLASRLWPEVIQGRMPEWMKNTGASLWFRRVR